MIFETAIEELEGIVKKLEAGNVSLNESISLFEKGISLSDACSIMLKEAKQRIEVIKSENYKENEYFQLHQRLNNLKRSSDAMKKGGFKILWKSDNVFACARFYKEELYIAITSMEKEDTKEVNIPIIFFGKQFSIPSSDIFGSEITVEKIESGQEVVKIAPGVSYLICASVNNRV